MARRKRRQAEGQPSTWMATYADMITLMFCFFVIMFNPDAVTQAQIDAIAAAMQGGLGARLGGLTLSPGRNADLGAVIMAMPAMERGRAMGTALRRAQSVFAPEIRTNQVRITHDERGVVITLASDAFFAPASARLNIEATREILLRVGGLLASEELAGRRFRLEGHSDSVPVDPAGPWQSNWDLSAARSIAVLHYLVELGLPEGRFQIAGFADTVPIATNATPEGRAYNRRVDIIILDDAHL